MLINMTTGSKSALLHGWGRENRRITLQLGNNSVDATDWDEMLKNPLIAEWVKLGWLIPGPRDQNIETLSGLSPDEACRIARGTFREALLRQWSDSEKRRKVRAAIDAQLDRVAVRDPDEEDAK